jgi:phosphoglycerol transferase MdoB-like AlkP superfamily enzyme
MAQQTNVYGGGAGFASLLTIAFIVLKLTHVIDWSWWWILSPLWIGFAIGILVLILVILFIISME